jgi:predicted RNase H-like HicB family nuclease
MAFEITYERETDGRWIADFERLPGVMAYGRTRKEAKKKVEALATQITGAYANRKEEHDGSE